MASSQKPLSILAPKVINIDQKQAIEQLERYKKDTDERIGNMIVNVRQQTQEIIDQAKEMVSIEVPDRSKLDGHGYVFQRTAALREGQHQFFLQGNRSSVDLRFPDGNMHPYYDAGEYRFTFIIEKIDKEDE